MKYNPDISNQSLGRFVGAFKSVATVKAKGMFAGDKLFQRGFYDHIIRNQDDLTEIRNYIMNNPIRWEMKRKNGTKQDN